tara:strand:- start:2864 stop:3106 length:243 start_codon:yes stop_codon:yes gene_type:complete
MNKLISIESLVSFIVFLSVGLANDSFSILGDAVVASLSIILATIFDKVLKNSENKNTGAIFFYSLIIFLIAQWIYLSSLS